MTTDHTGPEPGPGYSEDDPGGPVPRLALVVEGMGIYEVNGEPHVVIEVRLAAGRHLLAVPLDADDTEGIARLAAHVAATSRHDA